uniref:Uncharacterized protein n=1 Tax=viral metagenome TaxID=1070528 RepID=A0A6H2A1R4_9ZZZZ
MPEVRIFTCVELFSLLDEPAHSDPQVAQLVQRLIYTALDAKERSALWVAEIEFLRECLGDKNWTLPG